MHIFTHNDCLKHTLFPLFSERPERLLALQALFNEMGLDTIEAKKAEIEWIARAHSQSYIDEVRAISQKGFLSATFANIMSERIQWYTRISPDTYNAALYAAGAVCQAVEAVSAGDIKKAFCTVRPPGHHAGPEKGEGFCVFNNIAIGALHAQEHGLERVAIIDFDRHHGNGTQSIIKQSMDANLFLASSYQEACKYSKLSASKGAYPDNIITVPLAAGSSYPSIKQEYERHILPALERFNPDLIMISAGFDMHIDDPLTNLKMQSADFGALTEMLVDVADRCCDGRIVSVLEGGYELDALRECVKSHLSALER